MTLRLEVRQLPLRDLSGFFPEYSAEQLIETYAIFGGVPYYLALFDPYASLRENVINLLLTETGTLIDEPNTLLQSELREPGIYASIVAAISEVCIPPGTSRRGCRCRLPRSASTSTGSSGSIS
ncbi:AAA family ATPase [Mesorhizobium sp. ORS 3428]|uniref:AAA family ATPase n=1 Tax=Mesorhizobium sp. ORS 3428 TaxID=540997 RepID=UPI000AB9642B|nr:hypothetical protein [Mesorhizobium sp. ORS 3428]